MIQPTPTPGAPRAAGQQQPAQQDTGGSDAVSPEEQANYDMMVREALGIIYPAETPGEPRAQIVENLRGEFDPQVTQMFAEAQPPVQQTPQDAVAVTAVVLTMMTEAALAQQGTDVPDDVVFHAGTEIIELLVELSESLGISSFAQSEVDDIALRAMDLYRLASPRVDPETLGAEFEQIIAADRSGDLNKILPGAEEYSQQRGGA
ncbi:hypothetical protein [Sphingopyxis flava]|uniref:Uncharacterized protein n=1 Tax=Sphingopyxis flava TaxID=1507287 RepID=A0A1T5AB83_9SPHN|nr:hypothetical protein [Sphingopyxis flava]SKB32281.1 hypothetical protein SAMN06295937_100360 [Sphingopyxis flava]